MIQSKLRKSKVYLQADKKNKHTYTHIKHYLEVKHRQTLGLSASVCFRERDYKY